VISRWTFSRGQRSLRDVDGNKRSDAWVAMPSEEEARAMMGNANPYDFGFVPAMARLIGAHIQIAPFFAALFGRIMFGPGALERPEREMIAAVAAAAQDCRY
jgi:alkylhydroperoxidase family enzyme